MTNMSQTARLGKEVVAYILGSSAHATTGKKQSTGDASHAAIVPLSNPNPSAPLVNLRGAVPLPSPTSWSVATAHDATSALLVHADRERPLIHMHSYQSSANLASTSTHTCPLTARLHPPEPTPTLALSPNGTMLAAGSSSGRLYLWHLASGALLASVDAHFRAVTCIRWTADERALVSGGDDARVLVWSLEALVTDEEGAGRTKDHSAKSGRSTINLPSMPFAILADHVQGITDIALSSSASASIASFPSSLRILSASRDSTVKLWDVRSRSLIATWAFAGPVQHLAVDVGLRTFFAVVNGRADSTKEKQTIDATRMATDDDDDDVDVEENAAQVYDWVRRVNLFGGDGQDGRSSFVGTATPMTRVQGESSLVFKAAAKTRITTLTVSLHGSHLLLGTSEASLVMVDVASSVVLRSTSLVAIGQAGVTASVGQDVLGLQTFLLDDSSSLLQSASMRSGGGGGGPTKSSSRTNAWPIAEQLQRVVRRQQQDGRVPFEVRLERRDAEKLAQRIAPPSLGGQQVRGAYGVGRSTDVDAVSAANGAEAADVSPQKAQQRIAQLERENEKLNDLLKRAQKTNAGLWERVVKDAADGDR